MINICAKSSDIQLREISKEKPQSSITKVNLKNSYLNFHSNLPGANELNSTDWKSIHTVVT